GRVCSEPKLSDCIHDLVWLGTHPTPLRLTNSLPCQVESFPLCFLHATSAPRHTRQDPRRPESRCRAMSRQCPPPQQGRRRIPFECRILRAKPYCQYPAKQVAARRRHAPVRTSPGNQGHWSLHRQVPGGSQGVFALFHSSALRVQAERRATSTDLRSKYKPSR